MHLLCLIVTGYLIVCVLRIIFSWIPAEPGTMFSMVSAIAHSLTEPVFQPIRRIIPRPGDLPLDLSPAIVILVLTFLRGIFCR